MTRHEEYDGASLPATVLRPGMTLNNPLTIGTYAFPPPRNRRQPSYCHAENRGYIYLFFSV